MWQYYQPAPTEFERVEAPEPEPDSLEDGEVIIRFRAGAICGSDIPKFLGHIDPDHPDTGCPGAPLHEVVGTVEATRAPGFEIGRRVVGFISGSRGLSEVISTAASMLVAVDDRLGDIEATMVQPLSTVLSTFSYCSDVRGRRVAVLGLGPLGLLFTHVAKSMGAAHVVGVDRVDRSDVAERFGIDEFVHRDVRSWSRELDPADAPDMIIEAIGHRQEHLADAVEAIADSGQLVLFGLPEDHYVFPMRRFFRKNLSLWGGTTRDWKRFMPEAQEYVLAHPRLPKDYITTVFPLDDVAEAFQCYATPKRGRLKVALTPPAEAANRGPGTTDQSNQ
ncbi:zinc-binding dehydrogenase [Gulosibacter sp. 10]|uniref:zinc-binding dehydrogenase n=1 Tax=Gulosibacter sp. 10 TaxID=1255570 RepID=UPI00097F3C22|nr:zinc-binding dehydrogenase [Gulosibacter sp. 10]SJM63807.1 Threonine dehydrogenase and related Zn-dependent dehydrogenases [Gulosibacter sp. 10]